MRRPVNPLYGRERPRGGKADGGPRGCRVSIAANYPTRRRFLAAGGVSAMMPDVGPFLPLRPIRFVCPFVGGGIVDAAIRCVTPELAAALGKPVVIDIRPGGNGALAIQHVLASPPDGHTWMMSTLGTTIAEMMRGGEPHGSGSMTALALIAYDISVLAIPASLPARTLPEFLDLARGAPAQFNYLRTGAGSLSHLAVELLKRASGIRMEAVDYRGLPPGIIDLVAGRIQLATLSVSLALPQIEAGAIRALAAVGPVRSPALAAVPTLSELGIDDANVASWAMATVRTGTPGADVAQIGGLFARILAEPEVRHRLGAIGLIPADPLGQAHAGELLEREMRRYARLLAMLGIREG